MEGAAGLCVAAAGPQQPAVQSKHPCSPGQRRFWVLDQLDPHNPALNVAVRWKLEGPVSHAHLELAFRLIIGRHQVLRTWFARVGDEPMQFVEPELGFRIPMVDLTGLSAADAFAESERVARLEARASFDLAAPPLIRVTHVRIRDDVSMLLVTAHHIVCDGWSVGLLAHEMGTICSALFRGEVPQLEPLTVTYAEYSTRQLQRLNSAEMQIEIQYWRKLLQGVGHFEILADHPRPAIQTANGNILSVLLERSLTDALADLSRRSGSTMFMTSLTLFLILLYRYSGETDIAIGTQFAGRDEVELENLVGLFINTLLLRNDLSGNPSFLELLERVKETVGDAYEYQHVPLERLIEILKPKRDASRNALFSVNFIFQRSFVANRDCGAFRLVDMPSCPAGAIYDLNVFMVERPEGWRISCEYNTDLFDSGTIERLLGHFQNLMRSVVVRPALKISALPLLGEAERADLLASRNRTESGYPAHQSVTSLFQAQSARTPAAMAIVCGSKTMSYRELDQASTQLARHLLKCGMAPATRIGVFLDRSPELLITLLAILKAGSAYIPLDPLYPPERIAHVLENARPAAVVTRAGLRHGLPDIAVALVMVDADATAIAACSAEVVLPAPAPEDLAYVIYTSGSTGRPKGVQIQHRALTNLLWAMIQRPGLAADDVLLSITTICFDIAALELFLPLIVGARLILAREAEVPDGRLLLQLMQQHAVTVLQATPATWQLLVESGWARTPRLRMLCGGEALQRKLADAMLERGCELWNMYGPTETTIWSSVLKIEPGGGAVPIGPPIANTQFYVLDPGLEPVPAGVPGELYIGGDGVALGYHDLPQITQERFIPDRFRTVAGARLYRSGDIVRMRADGNFDYLGRADHQIKLRGFRIELGEIESVLQRNNNVVETAAIMGQDQAGGAAIWAYVVPRGLVPAQADDLLDVLRSDLRRSLPGYMQPSSLLALASLPRTPNGKIDRKALPQPRRKAPSEQFRAAPLSDTETRLAAIWASVLGLESVDRDTDFIDLGGHSLLAAKMLARIESEFGQRITLAALFKAPTVAEQARLLASSDQREYDFRQILRLHPNGAKPPLIAINNTGVYYYNLSRRLGPEQPLTALQLFDPSLQRRPLPRSFEEIAAEYVKLIREFQPSGPYKLMGWCVGGVLAFEVARQLTANGQEVSMLTLFDTWAPGYRRRLPRLRAILADYSYRWQLIMADWSRVASRQGGLGEFLAHRTLFKRIGGWLGLGGKAPAKVIPVDSGCSDENYDQWLLAYLEDAVHRYEPGLYHGSITLVCSSREPRGAFLDPHMGWNALCGGDVELTVVDGDHFTMFQEPGVTQMADFMSRKLASMQAA